MTIKEIEQLTGMTRANIRFYEQQGLLNPAREENNYREYTEEDAEILKKIKLLRTLHVPLEEIKAMAEGSLELETVMRRQRAFLETEATQYKVSQEICRAISAGKDTYESLKADQYLDMMSSDTAAGKTPWQTQELKQDRISQEPVPWRRYFARMLDLLICSFVWILVLMLIFRVNISNWGVGWQGLLDWAVPLAMVLFIEPLLLLKTGTTPGKWIMGLRVKDQRGRRRYYSEYLERTWQMLKTGLGFQIPIYTLFRMYKCFQRAEEGAFMPWDDDNDMYVEVRDKKFWRIPAWIAAVSAMAAILVVSTLWVAVPPNRGDITIPEFAENYNYMADYYGVSLGHELNEYGLAEKVSLQSYFYREKESPIYQYTVEDGILTGVTLEIEQKDVWSRPDDYTQDLIISVLAFAGAQEERSLSQKPLEPVLRTMEAAGYGPFDASVYGVEISRQVKHSGFRGGEVTSDVLLAQEGVPNSYSFRFTMKKSD